METASAARWHKPWLTSGQHTLQPVNAVTRREFRGLNVLMLRASAEITGTRTGAGRTSSSGSRSALRCAGARRERRCSCARSCSVEALRQLQGGRSVVNSEGQGLRPPRAAPACWPRPALSSMRRRWMAIRPRAARAAGTGGAAGERRALCSCHRGGGRPWIAGIGPTTSPLKAVSSCRRRCSFAAARAYYAKALHGLTHWSGHRSRLDRDLSGLFGTAAYAAEELVAEIGAAFLCVKAGVTAEPRQDHAHYLKSWIGVLKADNRAIFSAASAAQKAADYLVGLRPP